MGLIQSAIAPAFIGLVYIFIRDKYEKEPLSLLLIGTLYGIISTGIIYAASLWLEQKIVHEDILMLDILFDSFISSSALEEGVKYILLFFLIKKNKNFNEPFDGIVYSVFISLGFAGTENIIYVLNPEFGGYNTSLMRAIISVPCHGLFGVVMGYYFAFSKFEFKKYKKLKAFLYPMVIHGIYNFILLVSKNYYLIILVPYILFLWYDSLKKIKILLERSPFKRK